MNFYKHYVGDYSRDTGDLSISEHGAYRLMLDHFYGTGRPLPSDRKALYRLLRAEKDTDRKAIDAVCIRFFRPLPADFDLLSSWLDLRTEEEKSPLRLVVLEWTEVDGLINLRAIREMMKAAVIAEKNREIALNREQKRRLKLVSGGLKSC
jgi:uncharacterized protein YdaU (DUF1376 family)